ncbi:MAG: hypothetical protein CMK32_02030 [Porticoccaceae bacterium]|nr:hypothetical protein [Porticoccaceae bacterium]
MPAYVTYEKARPRFQFQMRIPEHARHAFNGRKMIKKALGNISRAEAEMQGAQLAQYYKALFKKLKKSSSPGEPSSSQRSPQVNFPLDREINARIIDTHRYRQAESFRTKWSALCDAADDVWQAFEAQLQDSLLQARRDLRRQSRETLDRILSELQAELNIQFHGTENDRQSLVHDFNAAQISLIEDFLSAIQGKISINDLFPSPSSQIPLVELWGHSALDTVETWRSRAIEARSFVNEKTYDKYLAIGRDLSQVLTRRPVESMTESDLNVLLTLWRSQGNRPETIKGKLGLLKTLLKPFDADRTLRGLVDALPSIKGQSGGGRIHFSEGQMRTFFVYTLKSGSARNDDRMLLLLMGLLATRLEEVYQLTSADLERTPYGWLVRIVDSEQSGHGDSELKTAQSARRIPIYTRELFPTLDSWLNERITAGGYLFPDGSKSKYGIRSSAASKRLNRILRKLFPADRRLVLQSTRNTATTVMRRGGTDQRVRRRFLGHTDNNIHDRHYETGELLDDQDLDAGARRIAEYLHRLLEFENISGI